MSLLASSDAALSSSMFVGISSSVSEVAANASGSCLSSSGGISIKPLNTSAGKVAITFNISVGMAFRVCNG